MTLLALLFGAPFAAGAMIVLALLVGPAHAGGVASPCAEFEVNEVISIIEPAHEPFVDCVRLAVAPENSLRPVPRPLRVALLPGTPIVLAALTPPLDRTRLYPTLTGGGGVTPGGGIEIWVPGFTEPPAGETPGTGPNPGPRPDGPDVPVAPVPLPAGLPLLALALGALRIIKRRAS